MIGISRFSHQEILHSLAEGRKTMTDYSLERLYSVMKDVFMLHDFEFNTKMAAKDVPGWDSLNHSILVMELCTLTGTEIPANETAKLGTIADLHEFITERIKRK